MVKLVIINNFDTNSTIFHNKIIKNTKVNMRGVRGGGALQKNPHVTYRSAQSINFHHEFAEGTRLRLRIRLRLHSPVLNTVPSVQKKLAETIEKHGCSAKRETWRTSD